MTDPQFAAALAAQQAEAIEAAARLLASALHAAVHTAAGIMTAANVPYHTRLAAARTVIDAAIKVRGEVELERRIAALEQNSYEG
jgi:hypothetical protein